MHFIPTAMKRQLIRRLPHDLSRQTGHRPFHRLCSIFVAATFAVPNVWAETEIQYGTSGASGINGVNEEGNAAWNGGVGGLGGDASAYAGVLNDSQNSARAYGGNGGSGGRGASAWYLRTFGGRGGDAGPGGSASATATTVRSNGGDASAQATAYGGGGGGDGNGGDSYQGSLPAGNGGMGGDSNTAFANASATTAAGSVTANASAYGGPGGPGGNGGKGNGSGDGNGGGGRFGSSSHASASGSNSSNHPVSVSAQAAGGGGGSGGSGYLGGLATSGASASLGTVTGTSSGGGNVFVSGQVNGGNGGNGGVSYVNYPTGGLGASAALVNAVSGSTSGTLSLYQAASGGRGGNGVQSGGNGGSASSILSYTDNLASDLVIYNQASGGAGGRGSSTHGSSGPATAETHAIASGNITSARVIAGGGTDANSYSSASGTDGGIAIVNPSSAVSTGSGMTVRMDADQIGGGGGVAIADASGGNGADSTMTNVVSGSAPAGTLILSQRAQGGGGGGSVAGIPGSGGNAASVLNFTHSGEAKLDVRVSAQGGQAGRWGSSGRQFLSAGGDATAAGTVQDTGEVLLNVDALAGSGASGGNAAAHASGISTGSGKVTISTTAFAAGSASSNGTPGLPGSASLSAYGQSAGGEVIVTGTATAGGGVGGVGVDPTKLDGKSMSLTNAVNGRTSGKLTLSQTALAGFGEASYTLGTMAGNGGDATSILSLPGGNPDGGPLMATVRANGGSSRIYGATQSPGTPGNATAVCNLQNAGDVIAEARAISGAIELRYPPYTASNHGAAEATASAISTKPFSQAYAVAFNEGGAAGSGTLSATAETLGGIFSMVRTSASAPSITTGAGPVVGCRVGPRPATNGANLMVSAMPTTFGSLGVNAATAFQGMTPLTEINLNSSFTSGSTTLVMNPAGYTGPLKLALATGSASSSSGLNSVNFTLTRGGSTLINQTFTDWSALAIFFNDQVIDLGQVSASSLTFSFTLTGSSQGFSARLLLAAARTSFGSWAAGYNLTNFLPDANDADGDGESDLLEFAFNSNPLNGSKGSYLPVQILADRVRIQFTRRREDTQGLSYLMQTSSTLAGPTAWAPMAYPWTVSTEDLSGTLESVTCEIPRNEAPENLFIRMSVEPD